MDKEAVLEFLKNEENKDFLSENGFQTEKIVEKEVELTDEKVNEYLKAKPEILENHTKVLKDGVKKLIVGKILEKNQYADLLIPKIDLEKIEITDKITGLDEQLEALKSTYPNLFGATSRTDTPPQKKTEKSDGEIVRIENEIKELSKNPSIVNRAKISAKLKELETLKNK